MTTSDIRIGDIPLEEFKCYSDSEKLNILFVVLAGRLNDHERQLSKLKKKKRMDTVLAGVCGFVGGFVAAATRHIKPW